MYLSVHWNVGHAVNSAVRMSIVRFIVSEPSLPHSLVHHLLVAGPDWVPSGEGEGEVHPLHHDGVDTYQHAEHLPAARGTPSRQSVKEYFRPLPSTNMIDL